MSGDEIFEIVDDHGFVVGCAPRRLCHDDPSLIHRCSHVVVYHPDGRILLQKRSSSKDIQPGKWDTAVGGHLQPGEDFESAALREMTEELGIPDTLPLRHICDTKIRNERESENVRVFSAVHPGPFSFPPEEIDEVRFWTKAELRAAVETADPSFTPNLRAELKILLNI
ncbi:MAG: hypothetical protein A2X49_14790 [Lentisphaerae bacterium GWF2_52_8]|nr:MAG: hypothetical protein A2X49_14790 [Lentisphaerae bacterium GWF2_52_8]